MKIKKKVNGLVVIPNDNKIVLFNKNTEVGFINIKTRKLYVIKKKKLKRKHVNHLIEVVMNSCETDKTKKENLSVLNAIKEKIYLNKLF